MKSFTKFVPYFVAMAATAAIANAQSVVTDPVGFITVSAKAGSTATPATTFIGLSMARPAVYQAVVPSSGTTTVNGSNVITFPADTFSTGQFGPGQGALPNFYLEILNGSNAGILSEITSATTNSITLADDISAVITGGTTTFRIRPHWTFGAAFGINNEAGLLGATTPANADIVNVINPLTGAATSYFFNTSSGHLRWEKTTDTTTSANDVPVSPEAGLQLARKGTTDLNFKLAGAVKTGPTALNVAGGQPTDTYNLVGNPYAVDSVMLKDSGLYTGDEKTGVAGGTSPADADIVRIYDFAHNQYNDYYFNKAIAENKWKTGTTDASLTVIPPGASVAIIRRANRLGFDWYALQPAMVLGDTPLELTMKSAVSRKTHTGFGDADVNLPLTGSIVGIEPRTSATAGSYSIYITYSGASATNPISIAGNTVTISRGTATIASQVVENGNTIHVELTGVANAQTVTLAVGAVSASNGKSAVAANVNFGLNIGDVNASRSVTTADLGQAQAQSGIAPRLSNFRQDINRSGSFNTADLGNIQSRTSTPYTP